VTWYVFADEFSWQAWRLEGAKRILPPKGIVRTCMWKRLLRKPPVDDVEFLLVESAWAGLPKSRNRRQILLDLMRSFRRAGIPVVFRNKEDPVGFDKFIMLAAEADIVLTTDEGCIDRYRESGCRGIVDVLPFAAQPAIHRQYLQKDMEKRLFFAGTLRAKYQERMLGYEAVVRPALEFGLDIFSRKGNWPAECKGHVVGTFPYLRLLKKYSSYLIGLNMSSVKNSPTMFPRRVVEMPLANILVLSDECPAVAKLFPEVPRSDSPTRTRDIISHFLTHEREREDIVGQTKKRVLADYTCAAQLSKIREMIQALK